MDGDVTQPDAQAVNPAETTQVVTNAPAAQATPAAATTDKPALSAEALQRELEDARKEAAKYRTERKSLADELNKLKTEVDAFKAASMTEEQKKQAEYEKAQQRAAELEAQIAEVSRRNQELQLRSLVQATATRLGIVDPDAAYLLLTGTTKIELTNEPKDDAKAIETALRELVKTRAYLLGTSSTSAANPSRQDAKPDAAAREAALKARIYGAPSSMFDTSAATARGGGVVKRPE
jgi:predicted RNase H-like nuclease (RuvC/YqgF family)